MIGKLDQLITLQAPADAPDGFGGVTRSWADVAMVWAQVRPVRASEGLSEGRMNASAAVRFTIRSRSVDETMRIVWQGVHWNIREIPLGVTRAQYLDVIAERGVAV